MRFALIASGPSLTREDCVRAREWADKVISVSDGYRLCPEADYLYSCDPHWWRGYYADVIDSGFAGELMTQRQAKRDDKEEESCIKDYGLTAWSGEWGKGLGKERINYGGTTGYQAINVAYLMGAKEIVLLGYDYQWTGGQKHFFGAHTKVPQAESRWSEFAVAFDDLAKDLEQEGVSVINCSRATSLTCFPRRTIDAL